MRATSILLACPWAAVPTVLFSAAIVAVVLWYVRGCPSSYPLRCSLHQTLQNRRRRLRLLN
jgi:hypothetical protein